MSLMSLHVTAALHDLLRAAPSRLIGHLACVFLARHWILGVANGGLTALLGLGALRLAPRPTSAWSRPKAGWRLRLRQFVLVAALAKGTFYLILGDGHRMRAPNALGLGLQLPSLFNALPFVRHTAFTIWRPTEATGQVGIVLAGFASLVLVRRCRQFAVLLGWLRGLDLAAAREATPLAARARAALRRAADALCLPPGARLPTLALTDLPEATPVLLGLWRPYILLPPSLADALTDHQLEMALRHELAHLRRRDHWHRWLLLWLQDLSGLIPLSRWCSREVMALDEQLCDRQSVACARDAAALAQALDRCRCQKVCPGTISPTPPLPRYVIPQMAGELLRHGMDDAALRERLRHLLELARANRAAAAGESGACLSTRAVDRGRAVLALAGESLLALVLLLVAYAKFFVIVNVS